VKARVERTLQRTMQAVSSVSLARLHSPRAVEVTPERVLKMRTRKKDEEETLQFVLLHPATPSCRSAPQSFPLPHASPAKRVWILQ
jgi:hypothetical protein